MPDKKKSLRKGRKHRKSKNQFYKMKGCSRTKKHLGGSNLAYPSNNVPRLVNTNLAYTGLKNAYPNPGTNGEFRGWLNSQTQKGGNCGCNSNGFQKGGNNGLPFGENMPAMNGIPYPNGTVGSPLVGGNISSWPGVNNVGGDGNYYKLNTYNDGFTTNIKNEGAQTPFMKGGRRKKNGKSRKNLHGGSGVNWSNGIGQDFINVGRQFTSGLGNAYNAFNGYYQTASPMPWKGQLAQTPSANALQLIKY